MGYALVTPPATEPVTLAEAKLQCRVTANDEDATITALIVAAREHCENQTGRSFITQTWRADFVRFPCAGAPFRLPKGPVQSVSSVKYYDDFGADTTLDASGYHLDLTGQLAKLWLAVDEVWPTIQVQSNAVRIEYVAGYGAAAAVPQAIKQAMLLLIDHWFENRGAVSFGNTPEEIPLAVSALLGGLTVQSLA